MEQPGRVNAGTSQLAELPGLRRPGTVTPLGGDRQYLLVERDDMPVRALRDGNGVSREIRRFGLDGPRP